MIRVALDAMGGDHAPQAEVEGALAALALLPNVVVQLVGQVDVIEAELAKHAGADRSRIVVVPATEVIGMAEKPLAAVRKKPNSSVVIGLGLQKAGKSEAFVSAGNTGAVLAASTVLLGIHPGVERATVATPFPTADLPVLVLDGGANGDNRIAILIPCHRVIRKMGEFGNYGEGPSRKKAILGWEAALLAKEQAPALSLMA